MQAWRPPASQSMQLKIGVEKVSTLNDSHYCRVRLAYNVPNNFLEGDNFSFDEMCMPESKGGTMIGFSRDFSFMVKELNQEDHDSLLLCCEHLCKRVMESESFITPTLAHFTRAADGKNFFATISCLPVPKQHGFTCSRFDLKGNRDDKVEVWEGDKVEAVHNRCFNFTKCWYGCDVSCCKCLQTESRKRYADGKNYAFTCPFNVTPTQRSVILESLGKDVDVLNTCGTMDYSLLVTVITTTEAEIAKNGELPKSLLPNQPIVCAHDGRVLAYYMGVIDYLQQWTLGKQIAHLVKCCCAPHPISTVPPLAYRHQFFDHFDEKFRPTASTFAAIARPDRPDATQTGASSVPLFSEHTLTEGKISENSIPGNVSAAAASIISTKNTAMGRSSVGAHEQENDAATQRIPDANVAGAKAESSENSF